MKIHISESTNLLLEQLGTFVTEQRGTIHVKVNCSVMVLFPIERDHTTLISSPEPPGSQA